MAQQYSLRWNNHQPNFISQFTSLLNTQTLVDVTLSADGVQLLAHKVVLSACSTYFQLLVLAAAVPITLYGGRLETLFVDHPASHPIVILKDVTYPDLRALVDFMYCGQINVTEEELPQVLATAKLLKIKGLHEMPDSTSLLRSHGAVSEFQSQGDSVDSVRDSPATSPSSRRRRRRRSSAGSTQLNVLENEHGRADVSAQTVEAITLSSVSSVPQQRRVREYHEIRTIDNSQQVDDTTEPENMNVEPIGIDNTTPVALPAGGQWTMMEHSYPRYTNACIGAGALQQDPGMYINNVINNPQMDADLNYAQGLGVAGPSPGSSCVDVQASAEQNPPPAPKRRRTTNPQSEENFQRALEAVRFGGIGFCKAARMFGVNNRTLWLEYKKKGYPNNRPSIKSRIKREHTTPPPEHKDDAAQPDQQMALLCPQHQVPPGFLEPGAAHGFPLQSVAHNSPLNLLAPANPNSSDGWHRRTKYFKRQSRVPDEQNIRKQTSEPIPPLPAVSKTTPTLQKHESYPQYSTTKAIVARKPRLEQEVGSLLIRAVSTAERQSSTSTSATLTSASASFESAASDASQATRASHTPAVRSGPPLSCNFCWNTVDECGRILRRKTQYHCPECRTNLCIVPCFHEYHDGPENDSNNANAR